MEVVTLNDQLRDAFTPVLRHLQHQSPSSPTAESSDHCAQHGHTVLRRLNTRQYGSAPAFARDLQQLAQLATAPDTKRVIQSVIDRLGCEPSLSPTPQAQAQIVVGGLRFSQSGVQGVHTVGRLADEGDGGSSWLCSVNLDDVVVPIGDAVPTRKAALAQYEQHRAELAASGTSGLLGVVRLGARVHAEQRVADDKARREASDACLPRLAGSTAVRVPDLVSHKPSHSHGADRSNSVARAPLESPASSASSPRSTTSSVAAWPSASAVATTTTASSASGGTWRNPKRKKPAHRLTFLRLRRLIQKKLCPHLRGQLVCVLPRPDNASDPSVDWSATGKLEAGRVQVLKTRKVVTFADYVHEVLGRQVSACAHMFLVRTRESIDDHLKVCDAFSEEDREQLGHDLYGSVRNYMEAKSERRRR